MYHFNHPSSFNKYIFPSECWDMVCHAAELPYVTLPVTWQINVNATYTPEEYALGQTFQWYWSNVARYGYPSEGNPDSPVFWKKYDPAYESVILLDVPEPDGSGVVVKSYYDQHKCDFWDSLNYGWNH